MKRTLVLGASENPSRYSNMAIKRLTENGIEVVCVGKRAGTAHGNPILTKVPENFDIHTITLYLSPPNQKAFYDVILSLKPERVIFNPGTENPELVRKLGDAGIEFEFACTLVMLSADTY